MVKFKQRSNSRRNSRVNRRKKRTRSKKRKKTQKGGKKKNLLTKLHIKNMKVLNDLLSPYQMTNPLDWLIDCYVILWIPSTGLHY